MKFGKNLLNIMELSDPEWNVYWVNYKILKKKLNEIIETHGGCKLCNDPSLSKSPMELSRSTREVEFFKMVRRELKKASDFYATTEQLFRIRYQWVVVTGFDMLRVCNEKPKLTIKPFDDQTWVRLLTACAKFYKDCLLLETYAITSYCAFSKILKKHDKLTGFSTREAFMRNVVSKQNFTYYPTVIELLRESEKLFSGVQVKLQREVRLNEEERLFIEALREMNQHNSKSLAAGHSSGSETDEHEHDHDHENDIENVNTSHDREHGANDDINTVTAATAASTDR